jgi:hypothetical protein
MAPVGTGVDVYKILAKSADEMEQRLYTSWFFHPL